MSTPAKRKNVEGTTNTGETPSRKANPPKKPRNADYEGVKKTVIEAAQALFAAHVSTRNPYPHGVLLDRLVTEVWEEARINTAKTVDLQDEVGNVPSDEVERLVSRIHSSSMYGKLLTRSSRFAERLVNNAVSSRQNCVVS